MGPVKTNREKKRVVKHPGISLSLLKNSADKFFGKPCLCKSKIFEQNFETKENNLFRDQLDHKPIERVNCEPKFFITKHREKYVSTPLKFCMWSDSTSVLCSPRTSYKKKVWGKMQRRKKHNRYNNNKRVKKWTHYDSYLSAFVKQATSKHHILCSTPKRKHLPLKMKKSVFSSTVSPISQQTSVLKEKNELCDSKLIRDFYKSSGYDIEKGSSVWRVTFDPSLLQQNYLCHFNSKDCVTSTKNPSQIKLGETNDETTGKFSKITHSVSEKRRLEMNNLREECRSLSMAVPIIYRSSMDPEKTKGRNKYQHSYYFLLHSTPIVIAKTNINSCVSDAKHTISPCVEKIKSCEDLNTKAMTFNQIFQQSLEVTFIDPLRLQTSKSLDLLPINNGISSKRQTYTIRNFPVYRPHPHVKVDNILQRQYISPNTKEGTRLELLALFSPMSVDSNEVPLVQTSDIDDREIQNMSIEDNSDGCSIQSKSLDPKLESDEDNTMTQNYSNVDNSMCYGKSRSLDTKLQSDIDMRQSQNNSNVDKLYMCYNKSRSLDSKLERNMDKRVIENKSIVGNPDICYIKSRIMDSEQENNVDSIEVQNYSNIDNPDMCYDEIRSLESKLGSDIHKREVQNYSNINNPDMSYNENRSLETKLESKVGDGNIPNNVDNLDMHYGNSRSLKKKVEINVDNRKTQNKKLSFIEDCNKESIVRCKGESCVHNGSSNPYQDSAIITSKEEIDNSNQSQLEKNDSCISSSKEWSLGPSADPELELSVGNSFTLEKSIGSGKIYNDITSIDGIQGSLVCECDKEISGQKLTQFSEEFIRGVNTRSRSRVRENDVNLELETKDEEKHDSEGDRAKSGKNIEMSSPSSEPNNTHTSERVAPDKSTKSNKKTDCVTDSVISENDDVSNLKEHIAIPPGKKYRRSLSIIRRLTEEFFMEEDYSQLTAEEKRIFDISVLQALQLQNHRGRHSVPFETLREDLRQSLLLPSRPSLRSAVQSEARSKSLSTKSAVTVIFSHEVSYEGDNPFKNLLLTFCGQEEPCSFETLEDNESFQNCQKIGEGVYGEVFMMNRGHKNIVLKIIPIEGDFLVNGEPQKKFDEVYSELSITHFLHLLSLEGSPYGYYTTGFAELVKSWFVKGRYPERLIELWNKFNITKGSDNDPPTIFPEGQLYLVLELGNAGTALESYTFSTANQGLSVLQQVACTLAVAEGRYEFEHRDLHWGNVLISRTSERFINFILKGDHFKIRSRGVKGTIIDFTLSSMTVINGERIFNDIGKDPDMFIATGDYQFDIYRYMKSDLKNDWEAFTPKTNVRWLHYLADKMLHKVKYVRPKAKIHMSSMRTLNKIESLILGSNNAVEVAMKIVNM